LAEATGERVPAHHDEDEDYWPSDRAGGGRGDGKGGGHRRPDPGDVVLSRRSALMGGGVLVAGLGFITAGALDLLPVGPGKADDNAAKASNSWVLPTSAWGARRPERKAKVRSSPPKYIVVHHTSTRNVEDYSLTRAHRLAQGIQRFHMERGWGDTGQHFTISRGGFILEGRHGSFAAARKGDMIVGTHVQGANDYTVGIECEGMYNALLPPRALIDSLVRMCGWLCVQYDLNPRKAIVPHRKFNDTDCCGHEFAPTLPRLREEVAKAVPARLLV
jgi:hypothetical protein